MTVTNECNKNINVIDVCIINQIIISLDTCGHYLMVVTNASYNLSIFWFRKSVFLFTEVTSRSGFGDSDPYSHVKMFCPKKGPFHCRIDGNELLKVCNLACNETF